MGQWTKPRLIAFKGHWYDDSFDYDGPACYELGTAGPKLEVFSGTTSEKPVMNGQEFLVTPETVLIYQRLSIGI